MVVRVKKATKSQKNCVWATSSLLGCMINEVDIYFKDHGPFLNFLRYKITQATNHGFEHIISVQIWNHIRWSRACHFPFRIETSWDSGLKAGNGIQQSLIQRKAPLKLYMKSVPYICSLLELGLKQVMSMHSGRVRIANSVQPHLLQHFDLVSMNKFATFNSPHFIVVEI